MYLVYNTEDTVKALRDGFAYTSLKVNRFIEKKRKDRTGRSVTNMNQELALRLISFMYEKKFKRETVESTLEAFKLIEIPSTQNCTTNNYVLLSGLEWSTIVSKLCGIPHTYTKESIKLSLSMGNASFLEQRQLGSLVSSIIVKGSRKNDG